MNHLNLPALLLCSLAPGFAGAAQAVAQHADEVVIERAAYQMGTLLQVRLGAGTEADGHAAAEAVFEEVARLEQVLSSWRADSEVGRLNGAPPESALAVSAELRGLLVEAGGWVARTEGAFDPAVGALIDTWGLRATGRRPNAAELAEARSASGWARARFDSATGRIARPHASWWLDTGGFGKGAALRAAAAVLRARGVMHATLDFGGQLLQVGAGTADAAIAVADPAARTRAVAWLRVGDGSVATSGASERFVEIDGERLGHIIDARTGRPVPAWGSVTVVAEDAVTADVLSTALFVMGADAALVWAAAMPAIGVLILRAAPDGGIAAEWNEAMEQWLVEAPERGRRAGAAESDRP